MIGSKGNVLPATFRINLLANKHAIRKHVICNGNNFSAYLPPCLKTSSLIYCFSLDQKKKPIKQTKNQCHRTKNLLVKEVENGSPK